MVDLTRLVASGAVSGSAASGGSSGTRETRGTRGARGSGGDEYILETPVLRAFIADVRARLAGGPPGGPPGPTTVPAALDAVEPAFAALLDDQTWLPPAFAASSAAGNMGGPIGQWLLFRAGDRALTLFSLVVPPQAETPVHDHLAWGLVGLYRGAQAETIYRRLDDGADPRRAALEVADVRPLRPGDVYRLVPPAGDIHAVKTTSAEPSVSIHLLTNDTGFVWRHAFDPATGAVRPFRSGYSNVLCVPDDAPGVSPPA